MSSYTFKQCYVAYYMFKINDGTANNIPGFSSLIASLSRKVEETICNEVLTQSIIIPCQLTNKHNVNRIINLYRNMLVNERVKNTLYQIFSADDKSLYILNTNKNIAQKNFQYNGFECILCGNHLTDVFRSINSTVKGAICCVYEVDGPIIGIHYSKYCHKCNATHEYGRVVLYKDIKSDGDIIILSANDLQYYQISESTMIHIDLIKNFGDIYNSAGIGFDLYADLYNRQHYSKRMLIKEICNINNSRLGKNNTNSRLNTDNNQIKAPKLTRENLCNSYFLYYINIVIYKYIIPKSNEDYILINSIEITKIKDIKSKKRELFKKKDKIHSTSYIKFNSNDLFSILYDKYENDIKTIGPQILMGVPVKRITGDVHVGHSIEYGDGGRKICRLVCSIPTDIYYELYKETISYRYYQKEYITCPEQPMFGNQYIKSCKTCVSCTFKLVEIGLDISDIKMFIVHVYIKQYIRTKSHKMLASMRRVIHGTSPEKRALFELFYMKIKNPEKYEMMIITRLLQPPHNTDNININDPCFLQTLTSGYIPIGSDVISNDDVLGQNIFLQSDENKCSSVNITAANDLYEQNTFLQSDENKCSSGNINTSNDLYEQNTFLHSDENDVKSFKEIQRNRTDRTHSMILREETLRQFTDNLDACRNGKNTVNDIVTKTGGILAFMTCSNFIFHLSEFTHLETPTAVIIRYFDSMTNNNICLEHFQRMVTAFGYDCMCNIFRRLQKSFSGKSIFNEIVQFYNILGCHRLFIDKLHIKSHIGDICNLKHGLCLFDMRLPKFNNILNHTNYPINEQVVEQFWTWNNKRKCIRMLSKAKFRFSLFLKREHHNHINKCDLESKGYVWEPIKIFEKLRIYPAEESKSDDFIIPSVNALVNIRNMSNIRRVSFQYDFNEHYYNIWQLKGQNGWVVDECRKEWTNIIYNIIQENIDLQNEMNEMQWLDDIMTRVNLQHVKHRKHIHILMKKIFRVEDIIYNINNI